NNILKEFLEEHSSEVINMLLTEWNWDDALAVREEEGRQEGIEQGLEKGREEGREEGLEMGREEGREEGLEMGREEILELMEQGYTFAEIKAKLAEPSSPDRGC
ncbi:MAG: hypothetical protein LBI67_04595, partial [Treponema sp.]|nr:hypothetical protein [Treponema sp.]